MNKYLLTGIATCLCLVAFSQSDFRKGYVILTSSDTLTGLVNYREGSAAYTSCDFKRGEDEEATVYRPGEIDGYGFDGDKYFESRNVTLKNEPPGVVFLEVIVKGRVSLYSLQSIHFLEKDGGGLLQLINEEVDVYRGHTRYAKKTYEYVSILNMLLHDCVEMRAGLKDVRLTERSLTKVVEKYNVCNGESFVTFKAHKSWLRIRPAVVVGVNSSRMAYATGQAFPHLPTSFEPYNALMGGIAVNISSPRVSERLSLNADIFYANAKYYGFKLTDSPPQVQRYYSTVDLQCLNIPLAFRYSFPKRRITPYVNGGAHFNLHIRDRSFVIAEVESQSTVNTYSIPAVPIRNYGVGVWGGLGGIIGLWGRVEGFSEIRLEKTPNLSPASVSITMTGFQLIVGVRTKIE